MYVILVLTTMLGSAVALVSLKSNIRRHVAMNMLSKADEIIVVTGLGIISPVGQTVTTYFDNICNAVSGVSRLERFDPEPYKCQIAAQVKGFNPIDHYKAKKKIKQNDLSCHFAVAASHMALADAGLDLTNTAFDANRAGVIVGSAFGGMESFENAVNDLRSGGPSAIGPYTVPMILGNTVAGIIAMETGAKGPNFGVQTACATGTHALGEVRFAATSCCVEVVLDKWVAVFL